MSEHRPFAPSPRRLALARRAGLHGASPHVTTAAAWIAFLVVAVGLSGATAARLGAWLAGACGAAATEVGAVDARHADGSAPGAAGQLATSLGATAGSLASTLLELTLPLLGAAAVAAIVAHVAQTRTLWLPRKTLDRAPHVPRDAGYRGLAFAAILAVTGFGWLWFAAPALAAASSIASAAAALAISLVALAAIDALVRHVRFHRALAMTHAERREDDRLAGADPRWRTLREKLGREDRRSATTNTDDVAGAVARAALIVLGDDVAVAIAWDPVREPVPRRTATGERARATQLIALARRYRLPIHRDPTLAAQLASALGPVPEPYWARLAEIVAATRRS